MKIFCSTKPRLSDLIQRYNAAIEHPFSGTPGICGDYSEEIEDLTIAIFEALAGKDAWIAVTESKSGLVEDDPRERRFIKILSFDKDNLTFRWSCAYPYDHNDYTDSGEVKQYYTWGQHGEFGQFWIVDPVEIYSWEELNEAANGFLDIGDRYE